jgi:hypothetical protein
VRALQAEQLRAENEAHEATDKGSNRRPSRPEPRFRIHLPPAASLRTIGSATVFLLWVSDSLALYARVAVKAIGEVTSPLDLLLSKVKPPT